MLHKVGLRKGQLTNTALWNSEFLSYESTDFVSMFFHKLWFYHILIITNGTSPNPRPNATRLCNALEADSCVNLWFAPIPHGDKCPKYLFNICELWQNHIPQHPSKASRSPHWICPLVTSSRNMVTSVPFHGPETVTERGAQPTCNFSACFRQDSKWLFLKSTGNQELINDKDPALLGLIPA